MTRNHQHSECWRTAVVLVLYRGLCLHFLLREQLFPRCRPAVPLDSTGGDRFPDLTPGPVLYFIFTRGQFGLFLFSSYCSEFSFPSSPPVLPGRSLPRDRLLGCFLVGNGSPPDIRCTLSFLPINHHAARIEMGVKGELLDHPLSSAILAYCRAQ